MNLKALIIGLASFVFSLSAIKSAVAQTLSPSTSDNCEFIREEIRNLPADGGSITLPKGTFDCATPVVIDRDHVVLRGAGEGQTILRLKKQAHAPILIIGNDQTIKQPDGRFVTGHPVKDVTVSDLTLDGNRWNQDVTKECGDQVCNDNPFAIRNNGLTIRGASDILVERVTAHSMISGGLVTEKFSERLKVQKFTAYDNFFDGFAGYETTDSNFEDMHLYRNRGAGISIDLNFNHNRITRSRIEDSGDVGIFARHVNGNSFTDTIILRSKKHGIFLAYGKNAATCAFDNTFDQLNIHFSEQVGIRLNNDCPGNRIRAGSNLCHNVAGSFSESTPGSLIVESGVACGI